jgi:hypothetical protein
MTETRGNMAAGDHRQKPFLSISLLLLCWALASACQARAQREPKGKPRDANVAPAAELASLTVPPRTPHIATFPCVEQCHKQREPNTNKRELTEFHSLKHLEHGDTTFWCNFCHNADDLDRLRLLDGRTVTFDESYRLCGECHGDKRRDWQAGIHGLQTGSWNATAPKVRRPCTACHDPHAPRRPLFQPLPPPSLKRAEP